YGVAGRALAMNDAVMLVYECLRQRETQPAAALAARDEWMKDPFLQRRGHAGAVVDDFDDQSVAIATPRQRHLPQYAGAEPYLTSGRHVGRESLRRIARDI